MSKRGPKPTPKGVLQLRQSWRANKPGPIAKADQKCPPCPRRLIWKRKTLEGESVRKVARVTWYALAKPLWQAGLLTRNYREALECFCDSFARYVYACEQCDTEGMTAAGSKKGHSVQSPWFAIRNRMWEQVHKGAACFGLTPADIASVHAVAKPAARNSKSRFFGGAS